MKRPIRIALVGRPNVGKSALFNRICQRRKAIVHEKEGVTRDRLYERAELFGTEFEIIDTGGIKTALHEDAFQEEITIQAQIAIEEADSIIMVTDCRTGLSPLDSYVASLLQKTGKRVTLAVNKVDADHFEAYAAEFYSLGIPKIFPVSAHHGNNVAELLQEALQGIEVEEMEPESETIKVAFIGRPNVGKSTLMNHLLEEKRCVVSPEAGTTRDAIDVKYEHDGVEYTLIDTAGIRKKKGEKDPVDKFAALRTEKVIERSDVCVLLLDATQGLTAHDKRIAQMVEEQGKGCVLLFNKWDLVKGFRMEHCQKALRMEAQFLSHCPMLFISALEGRNIDKIFEQITLVHNAMTMRISTGKLNAFVEEMMHRYHPPMINGKRLRIYYLTQIKTHPPRFLLFVNHSSLMGETYKKYLINRFRETFGFDGVPLTFMLRDKKKQQERAALTPRPASRLHQEAIEEELLVEELLATTAPEDLLN